MRLLKATSLTALGVLGLVVFLGVGTASATELYKYTTPNANDTLGVGTELTASLEPETSLIMETTDGKTLTDTCTTSHFSAKVELAGGASSHPSGKLSSLTFGGCSHTTDVLQPGSLEIRHIAGTTNGTVILKDMQTTIQSTTFGVSCTYNAAGGTAFGTLTGAKASNGQATLDVNAIISHGFLCGGTTRWTGSYVFTSPLGLTVEAS